MKRFDHKKIEKKWQNVWEESNAFRVIEDTEKEKQYLLVEFPYPSGDGLHIGHVRSYAALDVIARKKRAEGQNVLYPIGWDAFGLPTENYAIKTGIHPKVVTKQNTDNFRRQLKSLGFSFDWSREINTTDPEYYKWTQWIFLQMYKHGLAYKDTIAINWCPKCKIGLANEEVVEQGMCERCGAPVEKREKEQWMLAITKYAQRLYDDLDQVDYIERAKVQQKNWIGPSEGAEISFELRDAGGERLSSVNVFTTRPDTLFGATYLVLAPEHPLISKLSEYAENAEEVARYQGISARKTEIERTAEGKEKTGVEIRGVKAINPATKEEILVFIADYVLAQYGTGAIMAVPAHDERDWEFAKAFDLPIRYVIAPQRIDTKNPPQVGKGSTDRDTIHAIVRHPLTGKYLCLAWKAHPWTTFVVGGVKEGEDPVEAARREVYEETGYKNLKLIHADGAPVRAEYFAAHKDENRIASAIAVHFELIDEEQDPIAEEELAKHEPVWLSLDEITPERMTCAELDLWLEQIVNGPHPYAGDGVLINSGEFSGLPNEDAKGQISDAVGGERRTTYKLRDWVFSRQRYWGEPIPMVHCEKCGWQPVPEDQLPLELPEIEKYQPTDTGESPLANIPEWVNTTCPHCDGPAKRETDVMPNWAGSSWYYLRYTDPKNPERIASEQALAYWTPVDWYNGGMEHTTLHLLYSRFWHKFLYDISAVPTPEPYMKRTSHGLILAEGGEKMSKSKGNTVSPDTIVEQVGADTLRVYEMFVGPFDQPVAWSMDGVVGVRRFLERVWGLTEKVNETATDDETEILMHQSIAKLSRDIENLKMNTAVSQLMIFSNRLGELERVPQTAFETLVRLLAPFAPHMTEELWHNLGHEDSIHVQPWPQYDESKLVSDTMQIPVQVNGKVRAQLEIGADADAEEVEKAALELDQVRKWMEGKEVKKVIYVPKRLVNFVV